MVKSVTSETRPACNTEEGEAEAERDAEKGTTVITGERRGEKRRFSALQVSRQCLFVLLVKVDEKQVRTLGSEEGGMTTSHCCWSAQQREAADFVCEGLHCDKIWITFGGLRLGGSFEVK